MRRANLNFLFLLLLFHSVSGQSRKPTDLWKQNSYVKVKGNNNIIKIVQGQNITIYNLSNEEDFNKMINDLKKISGFYRYFGQLLEKDDKILKNQDQIRKLILNNKENGILNKEDFFNEFAKYIRENERLKNENDILKLQNNTPDFTKILEEASIKLANYDNEGYQNILESFKRNNGNKQLLLQKESATAAYLQAKNSYNTYNFDTSLKQINEALENDVNNFEFLYLKGQTLSKLIKYSEAVVVFQRALSLINGDSLKAEIYGNLGWAFLSLGKYNLSIRAYNEAIIINRSAHGNNSIDVANLYNGIGLVYSDKSSEDTALEYFNKSLLISKRILGTENADIGSIYCNIGLIYYTKQKFDTALSLYFQALHMFKSDPATEQSSISYTYNNIGLAYMGKACYDSALKYYALAESIQTKLFGPEYPTLAVTYSNIGSAYTKKKEFDKASAYHLKALSIRVKFFGNDHPSVAKSYSGLSDLYYAKENLDMSLNYRIKAARIQEKLLGETNPLTLSTYFLIGEIYFDKQKYDSSLDYYMKIIPSQEEIYGKDTSNRLYLYNKIGNAYLLIDQFSNSLLFFKKILYFKRNATNLNDMVLILTYQSMEILFISSGDFVQGSYYFYEKDLMTGSIYQKILNLMTYSDTLLKRRKYKISSNILQFALSALNGIREPDSNPIWITIYEKLGKSYCGEGNQEMAIKMFGVAMTKAKTNKSGKIDIAALAKTIEDCKGK